MTNAKLIMHYEPFWMIMIKYFVEFEMVCCKIAIKCGEKCVHLKISEDHSCICTKFVPHKNVWSPSTGSCSPKSSLSNENRKSKPG